MLFKVILENGTKVNHNFSANIVLPDRVVESGFSRDKKFTYGSSWTYVTLYQTPAISNLSLFYDKQLDTGAYIEKTWEALTNTYTPQLHVDPLKLSDSVNTNVIVGYIPNTAQMQLDSLLIRGISHKRFSRITTEDNGTKVILWLGSYENDSFGKNVILQDYQIGDVVSISGSEQSGLDGCWRVEELRENGIAFTNNTVFVDEDGYFIAKRAPIGGRCLE